jgi:catechol 2,3-dioxygenase
MAADAAADGVARGIAPVGFRLPPATHVGRVRLQVSNLERSISYYETIIGLRATERRGGSALLRAHGADTVLVELHERPSARPVPRRGLIGLYHFAILLPDRAALGRFLAHLGELAVRVGMADHLVSEALYLSDPDGLGIEVYADRARDSWRWSDGQVAMVSDPLDVPALIAAGGGEPWTGMPAGTVIGHVHLHVRDLDEGARFYHDALGFDRVAWSDAGALFLSAGGYHHHLGTNTWAGSAPAADDDDARLLEWELVVPNDAAVQGVADSLRENGYALSADGDAIAARDPWGTPLRIVAATA